ncbi:GspE/PulE family protein [Dehalogenimonas alkenigignens]|uniref:Type II secretory pathway, ATPase PulE/Tfp pilus assembly pathway, ATPase PilB n=1 Tax=Dehalogenimonas alkenigignens TaxID=1217799 RepID=A0A0W0GHX8_9CHLR|nr:GspE/PulE family protein [Dehalogenimonas alkenigignens]KTB48159.1 Type II secretory pathway, ATPase PulE/Tfp pilus assembly pathway, ATPase PilB [Dehalogenimonas alkenigignens]
MPAIKTSENKNIGNRLANYMRGQGYEVTEQAKLQGRSGLEHSFDLLARRDDGFASRTIAFAVLNGITDRSSAEAAVFTFANKTYDAGISERAVILPTNLAKQVQEFADSQKVQMFDEASLQVLLQEDTGAPEPPIVLDRPLKFTDRADLIKTLKKTGYKVEEHAKLTGRSGIQHTFDLVARQNGTQEHRLGIDVFEHGPTLNLEEIALFDTKAYDARINSKFIATPAILSEEAARFAESQKIRIIELGAPAAKAKSESPAEAVEKVKAVAVEPAAPAEVKTNGDAAEAAKPEAAETKPAAPTSEVKPAANGEARASENGKLGRELRQLPSAEALKIIPEIMARRYNAIPVRISGNTIEVAMANPSDILALEALTAYSKRRVKALPADEKELREAIDFNYKGYGEVDKFLSRMSFSADATDEKLAMDAAVDAPLAQALNLIIEEAVKARASDIHLEPDEERMRVRFRIDGSLQEMMSLPISVQRAIISRIKILSSLNIADHHHAQDGQFSTQAGGRTIDIRVATAPTVHGEMSVLRLLDKSRGLMQLSQLGFNKESLAKYENMLRIPYGMILISGPTGAGKTTTLYASLSSIDTKTRNVITVEDPAEYRFKDINQIQVNVQAGITFASGLRSILRLDPDVILVGEVRDAETANIGVQAALTGHLMLSSIHANDTVGVLFRLIDLGVEPFLISSAIIGVVAQRMVRRICPYCSHQVEAPVIEQVAYERETGEKRAKFTYGTGCKSCAYTGYLGRVGVFEIMYFSETLKRMLLDGAGSADIRAQAIREGMVTMMKDGMLKVKEGITTPSEILRSAYSPEEQY